MFRFYKISAMVTVLCFMVFWFNSSIFEQSVTEYKLSIPPNYPYPNIPSNNLLTHEKVELGRWLFYDKRLSRNSNTSCASCHIQNLAFTDGKPFSVGSVGEKTHRNSMSLVNMAYNARYTWANPLMDKLEHQLLIPLFGEEPVEMGLSGMETQILSLLKEDMIYKKLFKSAFPKSKQPVTVDNLAKAIASFQRTIISLNSDYDRYIAGDKTALTDSQINGMRLFFSEELECFHCHGGFNFMSSVSHEGQQEEVAFHNNGTFIIKDEKNRQRLNNIDTGVYQISLNENDIGKFKAPSLRNIAVTAPYMHDGRFETLDEVIEHYQTLNTKISQNPSWEVPNQSDFVGGFELTVEEKTDLLAFLNALTDEQLLFDSQYADPWPK